MQSFKGPLAILVCASMLSPSVPALPETAQPANAAPRQAARPPYQSAQLQGDERILHALNRFTFGPKPGDLEAVKAMGLDAWFNQQLHPQSLDKTDLNVRLAQFPAMQASPEQLLYYLPSNAVLRQSIDGKAPVPQGLILHAIYENQIARIDQRRQAKQWETANTATPSPNGMGVDATAMPAPAAPSDPGQMNMAPPPAAPAPQFDEDQIAAILALPAQQRVIRLASLQQPDLDALRKALKPKQRLALFDGLTSLQKETVQALENPQRLVEEELASERLTRDIYSNAQLQEVMTDFWLNHFNVYFHKNEATPYYLVSYERDLIRPRALGKFEDLLEATAHSPAMLLYLDNATSTGPDSPAAERAKTAAARRPGKKPAPEGLNENYARELMELHTLGVNGGYTQADVTQVARVLTGWTVDHPQRGGGFKFDESRHEPGTKKVLGKKIKENGEREGEELLHLLATRPATAWFLSRELAERFVGDAPPQLLVDRMAKSWMASGGDIPTVLKTLFHSPEFWSVNEYRGKVKTPIEFVVSAARAGNADIANMQPLVNALQTMGMPIYGCVPPTGYHWDASAWVGTGALVNRMNFALSLAANRLPGIALDWAPTPYQNPAPNSDPAQEERRLESLLVAGGVSQSTRGAVLQQFDAQAAQPARPVQAAEHSINPSRAAANLDRQDQLLAGLLLGSPEFQRR